MARGAGSVALTVEEMVVVRRGLKALLLSHGGSCSCRMCRVSGPLLARIEDKLTTPVPRGEVDQGEKR